MAKKPPQKLTQEGYDKLKAELKELEEVERPKIAQLLKDAIAEGDLSENAAYEEAKDAQARMEGRVNEIKQILNTAEIVKGTKGGKIDIGSTIKVKTPGGTEREFIIAGGGGSNPSEGKISYDSPLGRGFMGHKKGDKVDVETPGGKKKFEILDVK
ncbi:MAG: transcription elongation factor GreA [Candidatus Spechtbacterales bacterium]|nr:transcription elongation factor GreA [Candidatus Spechtbacterales bacterium]